MILRRRDGEPRTPRKFDVYILHVNISVFAYSGQREKILSPSVPIAINRAILFSPIEETSPSTGSTSEDDEEEEAKEKKKSNLDGNILRTL